jgi:probable HAF family extracellular repeat protein
MLEAQMKACKLIYGTLVTLAVVTFAAQLAGREHLRYKLVVLGTLGGPQSYGDPGHGAGNISNSGTAVAVADTGTPDPFYPNFNPIFSGNIGPYPFVYHAFTTRGGALVDLGGLGGNDSVASFIGNNGLTTGQSLTGSIDPLTGWPASDGVLWQGSRIIDMGTLPGGYESQAGQVNGRGRATGFSTNAVPDPFSIYYFFFTGFQFTNGTQTRAFVWDEKNGMQDIGTLGGPDAFAPFINERGQIAGFSYTNSTPNPTTGVPTIDPFLWDHGRMIDLGSFGGTLGFVGGPTVALNDRGQVVGSSSFPGDVIFHAFMWEKGHLNDLGTLGGSYSAAATINDGGSVIGESFPTGEEGMVHAFLWKGGVMTDLGTVGGNDCSSAFGINAKDQVVGEAFPCQVNAVPHAFLWDKGRIIDLNVFVPASSDLTIMDAEEINDHGEILCSGLLTNGDSRGCLLIPVGEGDPDGISATAENLRALNERTARPTGEAVARAIALAHARRLRWKYGLRLAPRIH